MNFGTYFFTESRRKKCDDFQFSLFNFCTPPKFHLTDFSFSQNLNNYQFHCLKPCKIFMEQCSKGSLVFTCQFAHKTLQILRPWPYYKFVYICILRGLNNHAHRTVECRFLVKFHKIFFLISITLLNPLQFHFKITKYLQKISAFPTKIEKNY